MISELPSTGHFAIRDAQPSDGEFIARNVLAAMGYDVFSCAGADPKIEIGSASLNVNEAVVVFGEVCARPDTLYSYTRTRIACVGGSPVGSLTAYSGDDYLPLRNLTWGLLNSIFEGSAQPVDDPLRVESGSDSAGGSAWSSDSVARSSETAEGLRAQDNDVRSSEAGSSGALSMEPECLSGEFYLDSMAILPEFRRMTFEYAGSTDRIGHLLMLDGIEEGRRKGFSRISLIVDKLKPRLKVYYSALGFRPDGEILFFGHLYDRMIKELARHIH